MTLKDELEKLARATKLLGETPKQREADRLKELTSTPLTDWIRKES